MDSEQLKERRNSSRINEDPASGKKEDKKMVRKCKRQSVCFIRIRGSKSGLTSELRFSPKGMHHGVASCRLSLVSSGQYLGEMGLHIIFM
jgi:hypothetical protein